MGPHRPINSAQCRFLDQRALWEKSRVVSIRTEMDVDTQRGRSQQSPLAPEPIARNDRYPPVAVILRTKNLDKDGWALIFVSGSPSKPLRRGASAAFLPSARVRGGRPSARRSG